MYNRQSEGNKTKGFGFGGFTMKSSVPRKGAGIETQMAQIGYGMAGGARAFGHSTNIGKRRVKSEEEYFEGEEEEHHKPEDLEYQPAPGSPSLEQDEPSNKSPQYESDESDDPLDAFMAGVEREVKDQTGAPIATTTKEEKGKGDGKKSKKGVRDDIEEEDEMEQYLRYMIENPNAGVINEDDENFEYDEEGNVIVPSDYKKVIDPLPPIDHGEIDYKPFNKNFYEEHEDIRTLTLPQIDDLRNKLGIRVSGFSPPKPVSSFGHFGFDDKLMSSIRKSEYTQPTPIQAQGIPVALMGRDIIGIAKTGSGKTAAFIWPLLVHIMDQKELQPGDGPIGVILAPTRELSQQIYAEAKKFGKVYNIKVVCAYGGGSLWEQCQACENGAEIIVATPGRLIDLVKKKATNLRRTTFLVFDEADRMFDMGFEPQVRSLANHIRPERQTLLFSATFRRKVERLARDILTDPIRCIQGDLGEANEDVTQIVKVVPVGPAKWQWLLSRLVEFTTIGSVLIFVTRKANCEELATNLENKDFSVGLLHGDMDQTERNKVITIFKKKEIPILVATDVAARGLDIPSIKTVVNFDPARDIDTHTHRVGRTGRAGEKGTAFTLITQKDKDFAGHLLRNLEGANQYVPADLVDLAMQNPWFKKTRHKHSKAKNLNLGGKGLGFRERPGLGSGSGEEKSSHGHHHSSGRSGGPQSDRVSQMRSAFEAQFKSNFVQATTDPVWKGSEYTDPNPNSDKKRRKKSRWE